MVVVWCGEVVMGLWWSGDKGGSGGSGEDREGVMI